MVADALEKMSPSLREIAEMLQERGGDDAPAYSTVRAWRTGKRTPSRDNLRLLAEIASTQSAALSRFAARLEIAAEEGES